MIARRAFLACLSPLIAAIKDKPPIQKIRSSNPERVGSKIFWDGKHRTVTACICRNHAYDLELGDA